MTEQELASIPPDRLGPFELLKLMHRQKLDMSHEQVGDLLAEVEQLRDVLANAHKYAGCAYEPGEHPDATDARQGCSICAVLAGAQKRHEAIRNRGNTEGREG